VVSTLGGPRHAAKTPQLRRQRLRPSWRRLLRRGRTSGKVEFRRSTQVVELTPEQSVLEAAEDANIQIPFEYRSGICGQCKTRLLEGRVTMQVEDALNGTDRSHGVILACQAHAATQSIVVDA
jgi:glycine betaine catabolism B